MAVSERLLAKDCWRKTASERPMATGWSGDWLVAGRLAAVRLWTIARTDTLCVYSHSFSENQLPGLPLPGWTPSRRTPDGAFVGLGLPAEKPTAIPVEVVGGVKFENGAIAGGSAGQSRSIKGSVRTGGEGVFGHAASVVGVAEALQDG